MKKRLISMLLVLVMVLAMLPVSVMAQTTDNPEVPQTDGTIDDQQPGDENAGAEVSAELVAERDEMDGVYYDQELTIVITVNAYDDIGQPMDLTFGFDGEEQEFSASYQIGEGAVLPFADDLVEHQFEALDACVEIVVKARFSGPGYCSFGAELSNRATTGFYEDLICREHVSADDGFCSVCGECWHEYGDDGYCSLKDCAHEEGCWGCNGKDTTKPGGSEEYTGLYAAPTFEELEALGLKVLVDCDHPDHDEPAVFDLVRNSWTPYVYEQDGETYCSIVVDSDFYILMYSGLNGLDIEHTNATRNIPGFLLKYVDGAWTVENAEDGIITIYVDCEEEREETWFVIDAASGRGGSISPDDTVWVKKGDDQTFRFYPDKGYEVSAVYVDGYLVSYRGLYADHHWSCKGCDDCWWIDWSQWYDCEHKWCDHDDCGYWHNGRWYAYDKCDHWYDSCYWGTWENSITFYDVEDDHSLYVEFAPVAKDCASAYYWDLDTNAWYHEATDFVINKGLMKGIGNKTFDPYASTTRGELVTMLYRLAGEPKPLGSSAFTDVAEDQWYTDAVIWAANKGIVTGYGDGTFGVEDVVTREQTVAILYRYAKWAGCNVSDLASLLNFVDADEVSEYAEKPFGWAVEEDVIEGKPVSGFKLKLDPQGITERVEMAAMLMRFAKLVD